MLPHFIFNPGDNKIGKVQCQGTLGTVTASSDSSLSPVSELEVTTLCLTSHFESLTPVHTDRVTEHKI